MTPLPDQIADSLGRAAAAGVEPRAAAGLAICGMGGSAVGGLLAAATVGPRAQRQILVVRDYALPPWIGPDWTVLLSSYSGDTEETLACWDAAAHARRVAVTTGGALAERARAAGVPVVGLPSGMQPRDAVGYATVTALEVAALAGAAPDLRSELEAAVELLRIEDCEAEAGALAETLRDRVPVFCGAGLTAPVAYRWKCQFNENANRAAFSSELPELDHNEIEGWGDRSLLEPVFLEDTHAPARIARRFELTAEIIGGARRVLPRGASRSERLFWLVRLGDLLSLHVARLDGTDPAEIPNLLRLKAEL